jgi:hypothetical protein
VEHLQLLALIDEVRAVARRRGGTVLAHPPPPAPAHEVAACAALFDTPLPPSLKRLWERYDGFTVRAYGAHDPLDDSVATYCFDVRGPRAVLEHSERLRSYFASMHESGAPGYDERRARRYADIASFDDADRRTVLDLGRERSGAGEAPIFEANLYEAWPGEDATPVAASVDELIERCLRFMVQTEGGFRYWRDPYDDW